MPDPTLLTVYPIALSAASPDDVGANITYAAATATNGDMFPTTGKEIVLIKHGDTGELTITVTSNACNQGYSTEHNMVKHLQAGAGAGAETFCAIGPFSRSHYGATYGTSTNSVKIVCAGTLALTKIAVVSFTPTGD
jgi:hypothetical protein